ncbi:hypothetical protein B484DRAFT_435728, partial [Ochromonadaceae sp. CCMP2298]
MRTRGRQGGQGRGAGPGGSSSLSICPCFGNIITIYSVYNYTGGFVWGSFFPSFCIALRLWVVRRTTRSHCNLTTHICCRSHTVLMQIPPPLTREDLLVTVARQAVEMAALQTALFVERQANMEAMEIYGREWETHQQAREEDWQTQMGLLQARLQSVMEAAAQNNKHQQDELEELAEEADCRKQELRSLRGVAEESDDSGAEAESDDRGIEAQAARLGQVALRSPAGAPVLTGMLAGASRIALQQLELEQEQARARAQAHREQEAELLWLAPDTRNQWDPEEEEESDSEEEEYDSGENFFRTVDSSGLSPAMEEEETHKIMRKILGKLQLSAHGIEGRVQNIQHKFKQQGRNVDEKTLMWELKQFAVSEFEGTLWEIQDSVLENDCDYYLSELEEACAFYVKEGDKELIEIYKKIRAMYRYFCGEIDDEDLCADEPEGAGADGGAPMVLDTVLG